MKCQLLPLVSLLLICSTLLQCASAIYYPHSESLFSVPKVPATIGGDAVITCYKIAPNRGDDSYECTPASDNTTCRISFYKDGSKIDDSYDKYELFHSTIPQNNYYCKFSDYSFATELQYGNGYTYRSCFYSTLTIKNVASQDLGEYECRWPESNDGRYYPALNITLDLYDASDSVTIDDSLIYRSEGVNFVQFVYTSIEGEDITIQVCITKCFNLILVNIIFSN